MSDFGCAICARSKTTCKCEGEITLDIDEGGVSALIERRGLHWLVSYLATYSEARASKAITAGQHSGLVRWLHASKRFVELQYDPTIQTLTKYQ